jgi:choline/glycine/proline betaine transport protein
MFIARVSRGRTIRELVFGVLLVPTVITFLWINAFGGSALFLETKHIADITEAVQINNATALFALLDEFPFSAVSSTLGILLIISFFVTSSDSGSLVIDSITSGGNLNAPTNQKVFWAVTEGAVAATLLLGGGLTALKTASITTGLPFAIVLLLMGYGLLKDLKKEIN